MKSKTYVNWFLWFLEMNSLHNEDIIFEREPKNIQSDLLNFRQ